MGSILRAAIGAKSVGIGGVHRLRHVAAITILGICFLHIQKVDITFFFLSNYYWQCANFTNWPTVNRTNYIAAPPATTPAGHLPDYKVVTAVPVMLLDDADAPKEPTRNSKC